MSNANHPSTPRAARSREQRLLMGGLAIVTAVLFITFALLPFVRHWQTREVQLDAARNRVTYLEALGGRTVQLTQAANTAEAQLLIQPQRVLRARSEPLAASMLQTLMQDAADAHNLLVTRIEITNQGTGKASGPGAGSAPGAGTFAGASPYDVPATIAAYGDIVGVTGFLNWLTRGPRVLHVDRLVLQRNSALLGAADVVQLSVDVRAPVLPQ